MSPFAVATLIGWLILLVLGWRRQGRMGAIFMGILFGLHALGSVGLWPLLEALHPGLVWLQVTVFLYGLSWMWPSYKPAWFRALISVPASFWVAATFFGLPWSALGAFGFSPWAPWLPLLLGAVGVFQSSWMFERTVVLRLDGKDAGELGRYPRGEAAQAKPLRVVQISDPHLGTFMSPARLKRICQSAVEAEPDLILLTGDFLTVESHHQPELLVEGLSPLDAARGRVFACMGNHDHEAPEIVLQACRRWGVEMLIDQERVVETSVGPVQLLGADFVFRGRQEHLTRLCADFPRREGMLRLMMLHDPGAFTHVPPGEADLVLSGHTHGGQVGLVSLGLPWTMVSVLTSIPDHGFWARGRDRLYVHRGTGHYGFPLRVGVPAERGELHIYA